MPSARVSEGAVYLPSLHKHISSKQAARRNADHVTARAGYVTAIAVMKQDSFFIAAAANRRQCKVARSKTLHLNGSRVHCMVLQSWCKILGSGECRLHLFLRVWCTCHHFDEKAAADTQANVMQNVSQQEQVVYLPSL
jgi:hypothetical protein